MAFIDTRIAGGLFGLLIGLQSLPALAAQCGGDFGAWAAAFEREAVAKGISQRTASALSDLTPDPQVLALDRRQGHFKRSFEEFGLPRIQQRIGKARTLMQQHAALLARIEQQYGVPGAVVIAIWGLETDFGVNQGKQSALRSLATLAHDCRRTERFQNELLDAMRIIDRGDYTPDQLRGAWAGEIGQTQFLPSSFVKFAVDFDGNGRRDIWNSIPDALATAANLLRKNGWQSGKTWGYEVDLPAGRKFPSGSMTLSKWQGIGVTRVSGKGFRNGGDKAELKAPDGRGGPAFLVTKNFFVLKAYNNADKYALAVGLLADEIAGHGGLVRDWNRPFTKLTFAEKQELQERLSVHGYYDGKFDGKIGRASCRERVWIPV